MNTNSLNTPLTLSVATKTWSRDSHGLYDYESTQTKSAHNFISDGTTILRRKLEIKLVNSMTDDNKEDEYLLDKYYLSNTVPQMVFPDEKNINELQNKMWYVIKHDENSGGSNTNQQNMVNKNEDYFICLHDIVKLGRVKYAANEISIRKQTDMMDVDIEDDPKLSPYNIGLVNQGSVPVYDFIYKTHTPAPNIVDETTCKYCLSGGCDEVNPLVHLCACTGGIKFSHYMCLKQWMQTKLTRKENEKKSVMSYNIKAFNCEICKTPYPCKYIFFCFYLIRLKNCPFFLLKTAPSP
jgi:hypothetical protein